VNRQERKDRPLHTAVFGGFGQGPQEFADGFMEKFPKTENRFPGRFGKKSYWEVLLGIAL
jgi:hypothetical protein